MRTARPRTSEKRALRAIDEDEAWDLVRALARLGRDPAQPGEIGLSSGDERVVRVSVAEEGGLVVRVDAERQISWRAMAELSPAAAELLELCIPLCFGANLVVAHLGQSLDGRVAMPPGRPRLITGVEDVRHTHRLRALFDAVIVGATTVQVDDPRLTTRLVPGEHAVRVVLDPRGRLSHAHRLFTDGAAPTVVVTGTKNAAGYASLAARVDVVAVPLDGDRLPLGRVVQELGRRGLRRLFVEGGGVTVSRFLEEQLLDRLHLTVAPTIVGTGDAAIQLTGGAVCSPTTERRRFLMGSDVLFDFAFSPRPRHDPTPVA